MSSTLKIKEHPEQVKARKVKEKFINRLIPPVRADYDRQDRYNAALKKQMRYLGAITKILVMLVKEHSKAKVKQEVLNELGHEYLHELSMTKLYCIAAGGGKYVPRVEGDYSEVYLIPNSSTYNEEVKMLVEGFFSQRFRGTNRTGASKWTPKETPRLNKSVVELLNIIHEAHEASFHVISAFLVDENEDDTKEIIFETTEDVPEEELLKLRDALLNS